MRPGFEEYDAFGPWILEINEVYKMPPLFVPYYKEDGKPLLLLKIPRRIERRDATPDMDLYDYVVGMFEEYICVLKRIGDRVQEQKIYYTHIHAVKNIQALLKGEVYFYTNNEIMTIKYNTVSQDVISAMIDIVRSKYMGKKARKLDMENIPYSIQTIEYLYVHLINRLKQNEEGIKLVAYQPNIQILNRSRSVIQSIIRFFSSRLLLLCTAFITNGNELIVLEQEKPVRENRKSLLTYTHLFLPLDRITDVEIDAYKKNCAMDQIRFTVGQYGFTSIIEENNTEVHHLFHQLHQYVG